MTSQKPPLPPTATSANAAASAAIPTERATLAARAGVVAAGTLFSRLLGLVREQVLAATFSRAVTDIFFVAFLIPNLLRQLLAEGAVQNGVLPVLSKVREEEGEVRARQFFRNLRGFSLVLLVLVAVLGVGLSPQLVGLFAGGYREYGDQFERTLLLTRWLFPYIFFMGTAALGVAALNVHRRFVVTSYAPALLNVAFIACALTLPSWLSGHGLDPIHALTAGVLLGGLLQVMAQWPSLRRIGYLELPSLDLRDPALREVLRRMAPVLLGFAIYYVDVVVARHLLSYEGVGAQSYFGFALRLCDFPQGIFVMAIQAATLPSLSALAAKKDFGELRATFRLGMRLSLFVAIPAACLMAALAQPLVVLLFERGQFDAQSSYETGRSLFAQAFGIWMVAAVRQLMVVFYALGDTRTPVWVSALDFLVFLMAALLLRHSLGHVGISWAVTLSCLVQMSLLAWRLQVKFDAPLLTVRDYRSLALMLVAAATATCLAWLTARGCQWWLSDGWRSLPGLAGAIVFALSYVGMSRVLGSEELRVVTDPLARRLRRMRGQRTP